MKRSVFFTLAVAFVMLFASCSKEVKLPGTTWTANFSKTITYMGASGNVGVMDKINGFSEDLFANGQK